MSDTTPAAAVPKPKKKKDKVRSAWISFVGRVVAQLVGAAATVFLGLYFLQRAQASQQADARQDGTVAAAAGQPGVAQASLPRHSSENSIAVLPLENYSADARHDYFADGLTEALIARLAQADALRVISRTSSMHYKGQRKPLPQIARELGVHLIVEGSVVTQGDRMRITAQLIEADTDEHLWAKTYDRPLRDVLAVQAEIAAAIAKDVRLVLTAAAGI
jgi:TolB-like protein